MDFLVNSEKCVTGFCMDKLFVDYISNDSVNKMERKNGKIVNSLKLFKKEGFSRNLYVNGDLLLIKDFCSLHILNKNNFDCMKIFELGTDLRSDICGMAIDDLNIYASIRNGSITVIDKKSLTVQGNHNISNGSFWDLDIYGEYLVGGNVNGEIIFIDKTNMKIVKNILLNNQNIHNIVIENNYIYAAGQNKTIYLIDGKNLKIINQKRNAHKKMFNCVGVHENNLITISYPCSEISFWDKETLDFKKTINVPLNLFGRTFIENKKLFIASKNIMGIIWIDLMGK